MKTTTFLLLASLAGAVGAAFGLWLAVPPVCFNTDNMTKWTPECVAVMAAKRNAASIR
jgi:hypothetical protein